jgi:hypothetical protein
MAKNIEDEFSQDKVPNSNWFKFEKVGDFVKGTLSEKGTKKGSDGFKDQIIYNLVNAKAVQGGKTLSETEYTVGISSDYVNSRLKNVVIGDIMGVKFDKEVETSTSKKFKNPAKSLLPNVFGKDPDFKAKIDFE